MANTVQAPLQTFLDEAVREYRDKVLERILKQDVRKPWMKYREIRVMEDLLAGLRPKRALEWGAGYGTSHFSRLLVPGAPGGAWIAIEHDPAWATRIREGAPSNVEVHTVPAEREPWLPENGDGAYADFRSYVEYPDRFEPFDFILIDGRAREACLRKARELLAPGGVVVLHDANRLSMRPQLDLFPHQLLFQDYRRYSGGIWIGSVDRELPPLFDLSRHRRIWHLYNVLGRRFRL
jgi:predicted O-methyltransferase YrrM